MYGSEFQTIETSAHRNAAILNRKELFLRACRCEAVERVPGLDHAPGRALSA